MTTVRPHQRHAHSRGFTIMELMVAIAVASLLLFLINFIFSDTVRAVSRGIALSDVIANTRGAGDQFKLDADAMVGPDTDAATPSGFLVIANFDVGTEVRRGPRLREEAVDVRADQVMFIRARDDGGKPLLPISPESSGVFTNDFEDGSGTEFAADYVKVWYGTLQQTAPDGVTTAALGSGVNRIANDWILGRHAMMLCKEPPAVGGVAVTGVHAASAKSSATVGGYGSLPGGFPNAVYGGLTDIAGTGDATTGEGLLAINNGLAGAGSYATEAYTYCFLANRLQVNIEPQFVSGNDTYSFAAWQVAHMHAAFLAHVSDFIVEFAADTDLDGNIDTDSDDNGAPDTGDGGIIMWYAADEYENYPGMAGTYDSAKPTTYRLPAGAYRTAVFDTADTANRKGVFVWQHNDAAAALTGDVTPPIQNSYWPYLIRIRYRMHDSRGTIESGDNQHGMWFEHILKVNRPD